MKTTFDQTKTLIQECGEHITVLVEGEPGIGKSAMLYDLAKENPRYKPVYLEAQLLDLGDIQMPLVDAKTGVRFVPNEAFISNKPLLLMIDELGKAMRPVQNALLRVIHERKLGSYHLPKGSIVFATTNLSSDGVGDVIQSHAANRMTRVRMGKPTADEMIAYGANNGFAPEVLAWIQAYPHCLNTYTDDPENPYIFNPKKPARAYVSPRSLEKAGYILNKRAHFAPDALIAALAGTVGEPAARDMQAYLALGDALPDWGHMMKSPKTCPVPKSPIAQQMLVLSAVNRLDTSSVTPWLTYMTRLKPEVMALFATMAMRGSKATLLATDPAFKAYAVKYAWIY